MNGPNPVWTSARKKTNQSRPRRLSDDGRRAPDEGNDLARAEQRVPSPVGLCTSASPSAHRPHPQFIEDVAQTKSRQNWIASIQEPAWSPHSAPPPACRGGTQVRP